jgi:hypothetical protein
MLKASIECCVNAWYTSNGMAAAEAVLSAKVVNLSLGSL